MSVCALSVHFGLTSELPYYLQKALHFFFFPSWLGQLVGSHVRDQRWSLGPLQWKHVVLTTGPSGNSPESLIM